MGNPADRLVPPTEDVISSTEFKQVQDLVYKTFGISLGENKRSLIVGRLHSVLQREGYVSFSEYLQAIKADHSGELLSELVNRISTNHTFFNRENVHYELFEKSILKETIERRTRQKSKDIRVWCAASSYGHEAYTLQCLMMKILGPAYSRWSAGLLATDINTEVLEHAAKGRYPAQEILDMPAALRERYFRLQPDDIYEARAEVRKEISFRRFNLMNSVFPFKEPFDVIFCRNVMIYFDMATKADLARKMHRLTHIGGYLVIGAAESLPIDNCPYDKISPGVYKRVR